MYGGKHQPTVAQNKDFSASSAKLGWEYFYKGDPGTAMKRFNQAWMFDSTNAEAFWGFGLIMGQRARREKTGDNLKASIMYLEIACKKAPTDGRVLADLAYSVTMYGHYLSSKDTTRAKSEYARANELFVKAAVMEPEYPVLHGNWSVLDYYVGRYASAKKRLDKAVHLGYQPEPTYVNHLNNKIARLK